MPTKRTTQTKTRTARNLEVELKKLLESQPHGSREATILALRAQIEEKRELLEAAFKLGHSIKAAAAAVSVGTGASAKTAQGLLKDMFPQYVRVRIKSSG
jgi:hypothetical protein